MNLTKSLIETLPNTLRLFWLRSESQPRVASTQSSCNVIPIDSKRRTTVSNPRFRADVVQHAGNRRLDVVTSPSHPCLVTPRESARPLIQKRRPFTVVGNDGRAEVH